MTSRPLPDDAGSAGRRRDRICIVAHQVAWASMFETERVRIEPLLAPYLTRPIEHIGSTAVPGLAAKPIIDMLAVVNSVDDASNAAPLLAVVRWVHAPEPGDTKARRLSFCAPSVANRTHHLHVVEAPSEAWRGWLAFRDRLRDDPTLCDDYADLKRSLAAKFGSDPNRRDDYRQEKAEFIVTVTRAALRDTPSPPVT
jgi:GrpB-like predicted nucleotidyltransferase (UPF0157 family)